jgi:hypothetical protein
MNTRVPRPAAIGCAALLLVGLLCGLTVFAGLPGSAAGPCQLTAPLPYSLDQARTFQQQFLDTFLTGQTGPFRLDVSSVALNSYIVWQTQGAPLYEPAVWFIPGRVCLQGVLGLLGPLRLRLSAAVAARLEGDQVYLDVEYARLGGWVLPGAVRGYLTEIANQTVQDARLRIQLTELRLTDGHLVIAGIRHPPGSQSQILPQSEAIRNMAGCGIIICGTCLPGRYDRLCTTEITIPPKRQYPPFYEKVVPIALTVIALGIVVLLFIIE